jgi:hypothetical protein
MPAGSMVVSAAGTLATGNQMIVRERILSSQSQSHAVWLVDADGGTALAATPKHSVSALTLPSQAWAWVAGVMARVFLPEGYPASVRPEYSTYQAWV